MKTFKRSLLLLLCVAMLIAGALVMAACSKDCTHEWGDWTVTTAATCMADGTETRTCGACGETETKPIDKIGHTFSEYVADGNATCLADGTKTATCTTSGCTAKDTVADAGSKKAHTFTTYTSNGDATCQADGTKTAACDTDGCTATETVTDTGSKKAHAFTTYHSDNNATCQADGTKTATCDYYGCNETDTVDDTGSKKAHSFTEYQSNSDATCVLDGTKTATCDFDGCNESDTIEDEGSKLGHLWNTERTCEVGHYCTRGGGCDAEEAALGHNYTVIGGTELTCEQDSTTIYACQNGCGDTFTVTNEVAKGHSVENWEFDHEEFLGECTYKLTYMGTCQNSKCGEIVTKTETTERHTLKSTIHTDATCSVPGKKLISCVNCTTYSTLENYTNPEAHTWAVKSVDGNVTTYECTGCHITKTAITATEDTETTVDKGTLESTGEVELKDASISLDKNTLDGLEGDVQISAGTLEGKDLEDVMGSLGSDKLAQIGDNPIYNFGLNDAKGAVSDFGGWVTIRVPYTLEDGEDVDSIAVWFINDNGEVESIEATYDNGYAVFSTNHFSYYTVTRLTPKERCNLYGHSYKETVVDATCVSDGYVIKVCQRCGDSAKEITGKATGHAITTATVAASCTASGTATHSCGNCDYERVEKIAPTGHAWEEGDKLAATCKNAGYTVYECSKCDESYKTVIAQMAHSYTDTVTKATCTTDGYTTRVCEWCGYTVTTNKIAALGHDYKTSVVANGCTTEGYTLHDCSRCDASYKTDIVPPSHTWDIEAPTCGKGQTCIVCGKGGLAATGNHTMTNGVCSVCGTGCKHSYDSVVTAPTCTEVGFTTNTCTICGVVEKTDYKTATGHTGALSCTVCGESIVPADFYTNILESFLNEKYTILIDSLMMEEDMYIVDSEIFISIKGGVNGWGTVNIKAYGAIATFRAIIEDGVLYLCGENTITLTQSKDIYATMPLVELIAQTDAPSSVAMILALVMNEETLNWANDSLLPFVMNLVADGKDEANLVAKTVVELIANVEEIDGDIVITPSIEKIKALNARLANETIGEFIDTEFGAGTYDSIVEKIDGLFDLTLGEIIEGAKDNGADVIALVDSIDVLVGTLFGGDVTLSDIMELETSIQDMLKDDELRATTVEQIVEMLAENMGGSNGPQPMPEDKPDHNENGEIIIKPVQPKSGTAIKDVVVDGSDGTVEDDSESIRVQLIEMLNQFKNATLYQIMGADMKADEAIKIVNDSIDTVFGDLEVSIKTDKNGTLISLDVAYGEYCDLSVVADYTSDIDYSEVKANAEANTAVKIGKDYLEGIYEDGEYVFEIDEDGNLVSVWYTNSYEHKRLWESQNDDQGNYIEIFIVETQDSEYIADLTNAAIASHSDCGDWIGIAMMAYGTCNRTSKTVVERWENGVLTDTIDDPIILEMLGFGSKGESYTEESMVDIMFFINPKTGAITGFGDAYTLHNYEEDEAKHKPAVGCEGVGEEHYFCTECGDTLVVPYTNGHDYEWIYELKDGATSCEDGVIAKRVCTECGKISNEYETNNHETEWEELDFSGYGVCDHHYFEKYSCPCGQNKGFHYYSDGLEWMDDGVWICRDCGITVSEEHTYTPGEGCMMNEVSVIVITKDGATLYSETTESSYESHDMRDIITLLPGSVSCEDGILVQFVCSKCGKSEKGYEEYYHREYENILVDLSQYGSVCGGYIYNYTCACGYYSNKDWISVSSSCEFEQREEYWREWRDYCYKYTCAVTSPACGFTYYERARFTENSCGYTVYRDYYIIQDGKEVILYSYISDENVYHNYEILSETKSPTNIPCLYLVNRVERCYNCKHENNFSGYDFIHENTKYNDGNYCGICGNGTHFIRDNNDRIISEIRIYWYTDGKSSVSKDVEERGWIYYKDYSFITLDQYNNEYYVLSGDQWYMNDSYWSRTTYDYDFSGECWVTRTYESSDKGYETNSYCACEYFNYSDKVGATCTQYGEGIKTCLVCGTVSTYEISPICHEWTWYDYEQCYVCIYCGLKNANGASGGIVLEDASDLDADDDTYIIGYYYRDFGDKYEIIYAITLINEYGDELAFIDLDMYGIAIMPWGNGNYITFSKSAVMAAAAQMGYTEDQYDIRISFVPVGWENDLDYEVTFEVMSKTDECIEHCYNYNTQCCIFCGKPGYDQGCNHWYENGWCIYCGERDPYYEEACKHWYEGGKCIYCGMPEDNYGEECKHKFDAMGKCVLCGYSEGGYVEGCKHEMFREEYCEPTCSDIGFKRIVCDNCGTIIHEEYIAPIGHQFDDKGYCTFCGVKEGEECKHWYEGGKCIYCGMPEDNWGEECKHEKIREEYRDATCSDMGFKRIVCDNCGTIIHEEYIAPIGHQFDDKGYCTFCGVKEGEECKHKFDAMGKCVLCGYSEGGYTEECKHEKIREEYRDATCSDMGFKRTVCDSCGTIVFEEHIAPFGHSFDDKGYCMMCGYYQGGTVGCDHVDYDMNGWCDMCGDYVGIVEGCAHNNIKSDSIEPTCTDFGYRRTHCYDCGMMLESYELAPFGHYFENGQCTNCGEPEKNYGSECKHKLDDKGACVICGMIIKEDDFVVIG